jgi:hypothetical protein
MEHGSSLAGCIIGSFSKKGFWEMEVTSFVVRRPKRRERRIDKVQVAKSVSRQKEERLNTRC